MMPVRYRWFELPCNPKGTSLTAAHSTMPEDPKPTLTVECQHRLDLHLHSRKAVAPEHGVHHLPPAQHMPFTAWAMQLALPPVVLRCGAAPARSANMAGRPASRPVMSYRGARRLYRVAALCMGAHTLLKDPWQWHTPSWC